VAQGERWSGSPCSLMGFTVSLSLSPSLIITRFRSSSSRSDEQACLGWGKMASYSEWVSSSRGHAWKDWHASSVCAPRGWRHSDNSFLGPKGRFSPSLVHMSGSRLHSTIDRGLVRIGREASRQTGRPVSQPVHSPAGRTSVESTAVLGK
jgi:hypothetical protein